MNPVRASLHHPQVTLVLTLAVFAAGVYSLSTMPRREDPKITIRTGLVIAVYPGATAEQVEKQVGEKIEERLFRFAEVRKAKTWSTSRPGLFVVNVELEDNVDEPDVFWSKLRHNLIELKLTQLPDAVQGPVVDDSFGDTVALLIALHGGPYSYTELKEYAQRIEDEFRTTRAVAKLQRIGEQKEEIRITSSMDRIAQYALSPLNIIQALQGRNAVQYGGSLKTPGGEVPLSPSGLFQTEEEIRRTMIGVSRSTGQPIYIGDLAEVDRIDADPSRFSRFNGQRAVLLSVEMLDGNNIVEFGAELRKKLERVKAQLPPDLRLDLIADQPAVVEDRISHFTREFGIAILAVILVTVLLLPFRVALIATLAIPVTVASTFWSLDLLGIELHQVSIAALIVVLGMVVDDAIVIADNYVEMLDRRVPVQEAAWRSATELTVPVLTATATIIASFVPMLLIRGSVGEFISALPITVAVSLTCSFLVAMLLTPILCRFFIRQGLHGEDGAKTISARVLDRMQVAYNFGIQLAMKRKGITLLAGAGSIVAGVLLLGAVPERFFPTAERPQFVIDIWLKEGVRVEKTDAVAQRIERYLAGNNQVMNTSTFVGGSAPRFYYNVNPEFPSTNYAQILVNTADTAQTPALVHRLRKELTRLAPEALVLVKELEQGSVLKAPIEVRVIGGDVPTLRQIGQQVQAVFQRQAGAEFVYNDFREDRLDMAVRVNNEVANRLGFSNSTISAQLAGGFHGAPVTTYWEGARDVPVVLRLEEQRRRTFENVEDTYVLSSLTGAKVPLRSVATLQPEWVPGRILHRNGVRTLTVQVVNDDRHLASKILDRSRGEIARIPLPPGYRIEFGGELANQQETFADMVKALMLSLVIIFLILLFQFRSPVQTLVIMMSIPLSLLGAVIGLVVTGNPFSFTAFLGVISLSGVVVRNAIILVDYINEKRAEGQELESAALQAGERRLRPIFLTTAAAAVGVTPMILSGSSLWSPLGSVLAVGLIVSMFFTLVVVPVLYVVLERRFPGRPAAAAAACLALFVLPGLNAQDRRITLEEAQTLAATNSSYNKLARLRTGEQEQRLRAARALQYPELRNESNFLYGLEKQRIQLPAGSIGDIPGLGPVPANNVTVLQGKLNIALSQTTLAQPLTQLVKIRAGIRAAAQDAAIAGFEAGKVRSEVAYRVEEAFYGILVTERRMAAARVRLQALEEARKEARDAVDTGNALSVLSLEAEAGYLQQTNALLTAELAMADIRSEFNDLLGLPLDTRLELTPPDAAAPEPPPLAAVVLQAQERNPEVRSALATVAKARAGVDAARADFIPEIAVYAQHVWQTGVPFIAPNNGVLGAKLSWSLWDWGKRSAQVGERKSQLEQAEENLRRQRSRIAIEVEKSLRKMERLRDLERVSTKAVELRAESARIARDQVELGAATSRAARLAQAALAEAEAQRLEAAMGVRLAFAELNKLTAQ
jgi:multidrug efflux pump subunit AcrB/outer membrane protein TolC